MKLSIIIPYYNAEKYTNLLLECLDRQMKPDVEVILIDDGSVKPFKADYKWLTIKRKRNGGASSARNKGLDMAQGDYVSFIDSDDLVAENYIDTILQKIEEGFDYCYMSWKTLPGGWNYQVKLNSVNDNFPQFNLCVWNRVYKRSLIGDIRFNTKKKVAEDAQFIREVKERGKKAFIGEYMYFYRSDVQDSLTDRIANGILDMNRIVYHFPQVTKDMSYLIDEFREADKTSEVILLTYRNEIPELSEHAMIICPPLKVSGTELRGEPTQLFKLIERPEEFQVIIWTAKTLNIGGIETFIYNFCYQMRSYYDILVLYDEIDSVQLARLAELVECRKNNPKKTLLCDTIIVNRITDNVPDNVKCKQKVQMVHACKLDPRWSVPEADITVAVSDVAAKTFELSDYTVINNMTYPHEVKRPLILVSATRTKTLEKGQKRMVEFARLLEKRQIPYLWFCFTDGGIKGATDHMICMSPTLDILPYIKMADYLVQLSDAEGFCYSIVEALEVGTPVIVTPIDVLPEIGFEDMINGYIVPFEITEEIDTDMIVNRKLKFDYKYDNAARVAQWKSILGKKKPKRKYKPDKMPMCRITRRYYDTVFNRNMTVGETVRMSRARAQLVKEAGYCEYIGG